MIITTCGNSDALAKRLAKKLKAKFSPLQIAAFPDGDLYLRFQTPLKGKKLIIVQSFQPRPDMSLFDIIFAAETAHDLGAKRIVLVAPYLAFMRQDKRFRSGEAISSRIMTKLLSSRINKLITIDPHLHRYKSMKDLFTFPAHALTANKLLAKYLKRKIHKPLIIGPDMESFQWATNIAQQINAPVTILKKTRYSSKHVKVKMTTDLSLKNRNVVIVDDIISTGHTIAEVAKKARAQGAKSITALAVHGLFVEDAISKLKKAGVTNIITTNTIDHKTSKIDITSLLLRELKKEL